MRINLRKHDVAAELGRKTQKREDDVAAELGKLESDKTANTLERDVEVDVRRHVYSIVH